MGRVRRRRVPHCRGQSDAGERVRRGSPRARRASAEKSGLPSCSTSRSRSASRRRREHRAKNRFPRVIAGGGRCPILAMRWRRAAFRKRTPARSKSAHRSPHVKLGLKTGFTLRLRPDVPPHKMKLDRTDFGSRRRSFRNIYRRRRYRVRAISMG